jgi:endonuclease/exonuclease/phosphatase family metal-dependent hydrolase
MPQSFRIASFNCENLFSRAKILNLADNSQIQELLKLLSQFNELIHKPTPFTELQKKKIIKIYKLLKDYIVVRENRGKLFDRTKSKVTAESGKEWDGEVEFKRDEFSQLTRENTSKVIKAVNADVACIVEAEDRMALKAFNSDLLGTKKFKFPLLIDGNDPRGIDVGVLANFEILDIKTHMFDGPASSRTFSRDCLRVELKLPTGASLHLLCNHFKSKSGGEAASDPRRERQSKRVAEILKEYDLKNDLVVVAGDLNDTPDEESSLRPLLDVANLFDVLELQFPDDPDQRWTYHYKKFEQIDYILVSKPLKNAFVQAGVERRGIYRIGEMTDGAISEFDTVTASTNQASDHGAVWAEFSI